MDHTSGDKEIPLFSFLEVPHKGFSHAELREGDDSCNILFIAIAF